ncbi:MAG: phosphoglucosamine mutase [Patescibacteria group bacterium]|jgi:phosphomannomutase|nr:phosphoglucosamine mutase [Patescibacteria group bacterium]
MPLIKSISGVRGTIGGLPGDNLTPFDVLDFIVAFSLQLKNKFPEIKNPSVVLGRDGRKSGTLLHEFVRSSLCLNGIDVIDIDLATTPTVEMTVISQKAQGGIILSASHNPRDWNALKLLNEQGEFISAQAGAELLELIKSPQNPLPKIDDLGEVISYKTALEEHIEAIMKLQLVNVTAIKKRKFKIVVDAINSVGALAVPKLLEALGVENVEIINGEINGEFAHNPEPLDINLGEIKKRVKESGADLGIVVDPDVDRLAFIDERGEMLGEEYTLVVVADYVLRNYCACLYQKISVSNLSSSRALKDITEQKGGSYHATAVGEVNVVNKMKEVRAVIGGEGNGGIIYPELHYGRDALVGIALFLSFIADDSEKLSEIKKRYPRYEMIKDKIQLDESINVKELLKKVKEHYQGEQITDIDGIKIDWEDSWLHLRASNTEPIIRIYAEAKTREKAEERVKEIKAFLADFS